MKEINIQQLFNIFSKDDLEVYTQHGLEELFYNHPVLFSNTIRSITNFELLEQSQKGIFKEVYDQISNRIRYKYFLKCYTLLSLIPTPTLEIISPTVSDLGVDVVYKNLQVLLNFFISIEYYEICLKIKEFTTLIEETYPLDR